MKSIACGLLAGLIGWLILPSPVVAQSLESSPAKLSGPWLTTPYPELAIQPGKTEAISLSLRNEKLPPQRAAIEVSGVPEDWKWALKGGGKDVTAAIIGPNSTERLTLELTPPADASSSESHTLEIRAQTSTESVTLPLTIRLSREVRNGAGLALEPELPALRGTARSTFSFKVKATNQGTEEGLFNLAADVPSGFQTRFKKGYGSEEIAACLSAQVSPRLSHWRLFPPARHPLADTQSASRFPAMAKPAGPSSVSRSQVSRRTNWLGRRNACRARAIAVPSEQTPAPESAFDKRPASCL